MNPIWIHPNRCCVNGECRSKFSWPTQILAAMFTQRKQLVRDEVQGMALAELHQLYQTLSTVTLPKRVVRGCDHQGFDRYRGSLESLFKVRDEAVTEDFIKALHAYWNRHDVRLNVQENLVCTFKTLVIPCAICRGGRSSLTCMVRTRDQYTLACVASAPGQSVQCTSRSRSQHNAFVFNWSHGVEVGVEQRGKRC